MISKKYHIYGYCLLVILIILPYVGMIGLRYWYRHSLKQIDNAALIIINKEDMNLCVIDYHGKEVVKYAIACGKNFGNKEQSGDFKTPEGIFHISDIIDASGWSHDFGDGNGVIPCAYGPFFIRLEVPGHTGIGIHGTHKPESIGTRDTEGCIRLNNNDLEDLVEKCHIGMTVIIIPSSADIIEDVDKN